MALSKYYIFMTVAECGNITTASKILCLTPSAISHSITKFEDTLGFKLFIRSNKGLQLTSKGKQLLNSTRKIISEEQQFLLQAAQLRDNTYSRVTIGSVNSICTWWLPDIIKQFSEIEPKISVIVYQGSYQDIVDWLYSGKVDIGFIPEPLTEPFHSIPLHKEDLVCVMPQSYKTNDDNFVSPYEINNWVLINQATVSRIDTVLFLNKYNLHLHSPFHIEEDQSILSLVEAGLGFSIMPELVVYNTTRNVKIAPFKPNEYRTIHLAKSKNSVLLPEAKIFYDYIIEYSIKNNIKNI